MRIGERSKRMKSGKGKRSGWNRDVDVEEARLFT